MLELPVALSFKLVSSSGVTKLSVTSKPTLYDGVFVKGSNINVSSLLETKKPFIKYTPACTLTELAKPKAFELVGNDVPPEVMGIVTEMVFQLGYNGTSKFKKTLGYIKEGSYYQASKEMLDSDWAKQTPERAMSLSKIMANIQ